MLKKILLLSTIIFTSNLATAASFGEREEQRQLAAGEIHGIFNLYQDSKGQLAITKAKPLNVYLTRKQTYNIIKNYTKQYNKQKTTEHKAQFAYQFMQKVAAQTDFTVFQIKDHNGNNSFSMTVSIYDRNYGTGVDLIPEKDMKTVFPRLLSIIKTQNKVSVEENPKSSRYYQIGDGTMIGLFDWPQGEDWFPEWESWVNREILAICYTNDGERLCEKMKSDVTYDYDKDGVPDEVCGLYYFYGNTSSDTHFHCRANN